MGLIFISYRRAGTSGYGGRLQEDLRQRFGRERVFRDIDSIRPGADFAEVIQQAVAQASVVLALIGSSWLHARNEAGGRRLDDPDDFVRLEIESAFDQGILVVPVLVEGARMPPSTQLPPSISRLGRTQAVELTDERWEYDLGRLVQALDGVLAKDEEPTPTPEAAATGPAPLPIPSGTPVVSIPVEPCPPRCRRRSPGGRVRGTGGSWGPWVCWSSWWPDSPWL